MYPVSGHFKTLFALFAVIVSCTLPHAGQAAAAKGTTPAPKGLQQGDWLIRLKATGVIPVNESSETSPLGGRVETPSQVLPTLDISYFLTDHWSIEAMAGVISTDYRLKDSQLGDFKVSHAKSGTASLLAQYHFLPDAALNPYLGADVNHTWPISVESATGVPEITTESITSPLFDAGLDYRLSEHWYETANVRYVLTPAQHFSGDGFNARSDTDVLALGAGMGLRF